MLITYKTAVMAKEKGFDIPVRYGVYGPKMKLIENHGNNRHPKLKLTNWNSIDKQQLHSQATSLPEQYLLQKWLREDHGISVVVDDFITDGKVRYDFNIRPLGSQQDNPVGIYPTYEEALEQGLYEATFQIKLNK